MIFTIDFPSRSPTLPSINIPCYEASLDKDLVIKLREFLLGEEQNILNSTPKPTTEAEDDWLTARLEHYNLLDYDTPEITQLREWIGKQYVEYITGIGAQPETVYVQVWGNIIRPGGRIITKHNHAAANAAAPPENAYISGNIYLGECKDTKTFYQNPFLEKRAAAIPNILGMGVLFPSYINHWINGTRGNLLRVSLAFDIITQEVYDLISSKNFRPLNW